MKDLNSTYFVGERSREQKKWIKMKPDYSDEVESLDLLILGAYYSEGTRRAGQLSHFLIGVRSDDSPELWLHIGKVGSGFTDAELAKFHERVADKWLEYDTPAARVVVPVAAGLRRDDRAAAQHSCLVSVTCFELCKTDQFAAGWTPRFPRAPPRAPLAVPLRRQAVGREPHDARLARGRVPPAVSAAARLPRAAPTTTRPPRLWPRWRRKGQAPRRPRSASPRSAATSSSASCDERLLRRPHLLAFRVIARRPSSSRRARARPGARGAAGAPRRARG